MSISQDQLVRNKAGTPVLSDFASAVGTPIVVDSSTSDLYVMTSGDVVTRVLGAGLEAVFSIIDVGPLTGWTVLEEGAYVDTAYNFFGASNVPLLGVSETNYFQFLGHDDNNTVPNVATLYSAFTDNHSAGTRASSVAFEADTLLTGTGLVTGGSGAIGAVFTYTGSNSTSINGVQGQCIVDGGTHASVEGVRSINQVSGGTITNLVSLRAFGPVISNSPTITNNYGLLVEYVGNSGANNWEVYVATSANPVVIDTAGNVGIGTVSPSAQLEVVGTAGNFNFRMMDASTGDRLRMKNFAAASGIAIESVNSAENAYSLLQLLCSALTTNGTIRPTTATPNAYLSSDSSAGISTTITTGSLVGKTVTVKDGIITGFA